MRARERVERAVAEDDAIALAGSWLEPGLSQDRHRGLEQVVAAATPAGAPACLAPQLLAEAPGRPVDRVPGRRHAVRRRFQHLRDTSAAMS